ncbi:MAG: hypothetical protein MUO60_00910 [Clostridiaceae bacterium]|nr:hypothetical protein [Clostridiaceae bacterium]
MMFKNKKDDTIEKGYNIILKEVGTMRKFIIKSLKAINSMIKKNEYRVYFVS